MNDFLAGRNTVLAGLVLGAAGIAVLWAGGVTFPVAVPPGMVMLLGGAAVVALVRRPWTAWLATGLGIFVFVGFIISGVSGEGFDHLLGRDGAVVALGQGVQLGGVLLAAVSGFALARRGAP
jgi:hypothetical protein